MKLKSLLAVVALVVSANAQAAGEWRVGVAGATNATFGLGLATGSTATFGIAADYGHELSKNLQLIGKGGYANTNSAWNIAAGLRYNFGDKIQESAFIQAWVGYGSATVTSSVTVAGVTTSVSATSSGLNWGAGLGNRWKISDIVAYTPEVGFTSTNSVNSIYANVVNFSIWF